ncbi:MAG TPA: sortase [Candidatus Saccharimonadales bacterium]|nr:sortase [Candidatus Saccharimonadales bacterium]
MKQVTFDENDIKKIIRVDTTAQKFWRRFWWTIRQVIYLLALFVFFFYALNYAAYFKRFQYAVEAKPIQKIAIAPPPAPAAPLPDYAPEVDIPKINVSAPLLVNVSVADMLSQLTSGVVQYLDTALPGQTGNMVLVGHSSNFPWIHSQYNTVFALVDKLSAGDQIIVPFHAQKYVYEVTSSKIVKPTDLAVLNKTDTPTLTLLTCYPVGTTRSRYIVLAKLVSDNVSGSQTSEPATATVPSPR